MSETENFKKLVANSPALLVRWTEYSDLLIEEAMVDGIAITKEDLSTLSSVRLYTLTGEKIGDWKAEAKLALPAFKAAQEVRDLKLALDDEENSHHARAVESVYDLNPTERLKKARSMGQTTKPAPAPTYSASEKASLIKQAGKMRGGAKVAFARKHGLL